MTSEEPHARSRSSLRAFLLRRAPHYSQASGPLMPQSLEHAHGMRQTRTEQGLRSMPNWTPLRLGPSAVQAPGLQDQRAVERFGASASLKAFHFRSGCHHTASKLQRPGATHYRPDLPPQCAAHSSQVPSTDQICRFVTGLGMLTRCPGKPQGFSLQMGLPPLRAQISVPLNHHVLPSPRAVQAPGFCCELLQQEWHTASKLKTMK